MQGQAQKPERRFLGGIFAGKAGLFRLLSVLLVLGFSVGAFLFRDRLPPAETWGYPAVFIFSFISSASVLIPLPGIGAVCIAAAKLSPLAIGIIAGVGESTGEITGYIAGVQNRDLALRGGPRYQRIKGWMERRGNLALFILSAVPNPLFDVAGVAAGVLGFPIWRFFSIVLVGKLIKSVLFAYLCSAGFQWVQRLVG